MRTPIVILALALFGGNAFAERKIQILKKSQSGTPRMDRSNQLNERPFLMKPKVRGVNAVAIEKREGAEKAAAEELLTRIRDGGSEHMQDKDLELAIRYAQKTRSDGTPLIAMRELVEALNHPQGHGQRTSRLRSPVMNAVRESKLPEPIKTLLYEQSERLERNTRRRGISLPKGLATSFYSLWLLDQGLARGIAKYTLKSTGFFVQEPGRSGARRISEGDLRNLWEQEWIRDRVVHLELDTPANNGKNKIAMGVAAATLTVLCERGAELILSGSVRQLKEFFEVSDARLARRFARPPEEAPRHSGVRSAGTQPAPFPGEFEILEARGRRPVLSARHRSMNEAEQRAEVRKILRLPPNATDQQYYQNIRLKVAALDGFTGLMSDKGWWSGYRNGKTQAIPDYVNHDLRRCEELILAHSIEVPHPAPN